MPNPARIPPARSINHLRARVAAPAALALALAATMFEPGSLAAQELRITPVVQGLNEPWGVAFLPDTGFLVTERGGRLLHFAGEGADPVGVSGLPEIAVGGQGGLLDVLVPRDFAQSRRIWISFAAPADGGGAGTSLGYGHLSGDGRTLEDFRILHEPAARNGGRHFGARLVEAADGVVFLTTGDRGTGDLAQDISRPEGKVLAFAPTGAPQTAPAFTSMSDAVPGLHSFGHRNIQGAALDAEGQLWVVEHGARGGDEVNRVEAGLNYGWPVISYGVNYNGTKIGEGTTHPGMEQPAHYWDPSIAPSGLTILKGDLFPGWQGHFLTGSLNSDFISRLDPADRFREYRIETPETGRVRDVTEAPDGAIWFLSVADGALYRMVPG
ncbi:PQQ-dependent sugar dehydrogenase [Szabonella alba]|uniref:PQQ-dependent sugar dehydrogenase n=1 Tax=Szabonella alba TaxID=2804194 RepID=A0A8K0VDV7_9RHOB|nr:PQQ-dependent sugar dehydrogenase [Szabonella alba]MBL4917502.1 PQQ-dependent sugar dehydrogenase [Szabonella alba]